MISALRQKKPDIVRLLIENGADPLIANNLDIISNSSECENYQAILNGYMRSTSDIDYNSAITGIYGSINIQLEDSCNAFTKQVDSYIRSNDAKINEKSSLDVPFIRYCSICNEFPVCIACYPCGCACICYECYKHQEEYIKRCPTCNQNIGKLIPIRIAIE